jgi:pimeloyl-ACP methyl ester carboxylesterase
MGDISRGGTVPAVLLDAVTVSTLVVSGGASSAWMIDVGRRLAESLPKGRHVILEGQEHVVPPEVLVPVLTEFFAH